MKVKVGVMPIGADTGCFREPNVTVSCTPSPFLAAVFMVCKNEKWNCTFELYENDDYGDVDDQGNSTGMVGAIRSGQFDTSIAMFTPTYRRFRAIAFSDPYFYNDYIMVTRAPRPENSRNIDFSVLMAFQWQTWLIGFAVFTATLLVIKILSRKLYFEQYHSVRSMMALWSLGLFVLASAYTGALFDKKLTRPNSLPYTDFESFIRCLEENQCRLVALTISGSHIQALASPDYELGRRFRAAIALRPPVSKPIKEMSDAILNETNIHLVWIASKSAFQASLDKTGRHNEDCAFFVIDSPYQEMWTIPARKNSPLLEGFNRIATSFRENALGDEMLRKLSPTDMCGVRELAASQRSTHRSTDEATFYFFCAGMCLAALVFLVERFGVWMVLVGRCY